MNYDMNHTHMVKCALNYIQTTDLRSNNLTEPSEPTEANKSRPLPALVKAISCTLTRKKTINVNFIYKPKHKQYTFVTLKRNPLSIMKTN